MLPNKQIELALQAAVRAVLPDADVSAVLIRPCPDAKFGDYQSNALMAVAKVRKMNPRQLATDVVAKLDVSALCEKVEIAGAGFLNFRLKPAALCACLDEAVAGKHLFFAPAASPRTIVVDFSSPNVAKPMHVGHIRSTGIGDALQRVLRLLGHRVISDNHIGDWGTQFGILIVGWNHFYQAASTANDPVGELVRIYKLTNFACEIPAGAADIILNVFEDLKKPGSEVQKFWEAGRKMDQADFESAFASNCADADFCWGGIPTLCAVVQLLKKHGYLVFAASDRLYRKPAGIHDWIIEAIELAKNPPNGSASVLDYARRELVKLQSGDKKNTDAWLKMIGLSQRHFSWIYQKLGVKFDHTLGESFYNPWLGGVVNDLLALGVARESEGAVGIFSDGSMPPKEDPFLVNRDGEWIADPALVRKSDGGFNYMTTDLATVDYRLKTWSPDEIVYVVDDRQGPHFKKLFLAFARWQADAAKKVKLTHVGFGKIMGEDGKPFKTRSGDTVKLGDLLDEAQERAFALVKQKQMERDEPDRVPESLWPEIARVVGLGSVKYADLLPNRQSDYMFSWDKMLSFIGNTAPYLQYAYARLASIQRKANDGGTSYTSPTSTKSDGDSRSSSLQLNAPDELALAKQLLNFGSVLEAVTDDYRPNYLCNYLYELAGAFAKFYESCPVLKSEGETRASRLALCELTGRVLKQGLEVLGIEVLDQM